MAKVQNRSKKSAALIVAAGMTIAGTGVAFAYWTAIGEGEGAASTGQTVDFQIEGGTPSGLLVPGGPSRTVPFTVTNPANAGTQLLTTVFVYVAGPDNAEWTSPGVPGDTAGCSAADFTVSVTTDPVYDQVAPGDTRSGVATIAMTNLDENQDACQNLVDGVPLYFTTVAPLVP